VSEKLYAVVINDVQKYDIERGMTALKDVILKRIGYELMENSGGNDDMAKWVLQYLNVTKTLEMIENLKEEKDVSVKE
jgi:hypothetical protein